MTEHRIHEPEAYYASYDKEQKWPKVAVYYPKTEHNPYPFILMVEAVKNVHGQWRVLKRDGSDNEYEKIDGGFICHTKPPDYLDWYAHTVRDFREHPPAPNHSLWDIVSDLECLATGKPTLVDYGINPFTWDGYQKIVDPVRKYNEEQYRIEWEKDINARKLPLVEKLEGIEWIEKDAAQAIMKTCEWKKEGKPDPWNRGGTFEELYIQYKGMWFRVARCDLVGQCPTTRYLFDGTAETREVWINSVAYGVVVTPDTWYVIDSLTDG